MSMFDNLKDKATEMLSEHPDMVEKVSDQAVEKAGDLADGLTGGKFSEQIDAAQAKADEAIGE